MNKTELGYEYKAHSARILEMSFIQIQAKIYRVEMNPQSIKGRNNELITT